VTMRNGGVLRVEEDLATFRARLTEATQGS
jgi:hypothetical protein